MVFGAMHVKFDEGWFGTLQGGWESPVWIICGQSTEYFYLFQLNSVSEGMGVVGLCEAYLN